MATLSKTRSILTRLEMPGFETEGYATFWREPDESNERTLVVKYDLSMLAEMGEPDTITVTIEPGDRLNEG